MTQDQMSQYLGCSRRTVARYESMEQPPPIVQVAYSVATEANLGWLRTGHAVGMRKASSAGADEAMVHPLGLEPRTH